MSILSSLTTMLVPRGYVCPQTGIGCFKLNKDSYKYDQYFSFSYNKYTFFLPGTISNVFVIGLRKTWNA